MMLLKNCRLVAQLTEGYDATTADVLLEGNRIAQIKPCGHEFGLEADTPVIDLNGRTLLPGFIEMHTHLCYYIYNSFEIAAVPEGATAFYTYEFAREYLNQGYTTVRDCGSTHNAVVYVRDAINRGTLPGPRLIASGLIVTPTETGNETFPNLYLEADGPDELQKAVRQELKKGNDFIKYMASGAFMNEGGDPGVQIATQQELDAIVAAARLKGTYVAAHAHGTEAIKACIRAGVRTIEHGTFIDDEGIDLLKGSTESFVVPTAGIGLYALDPENQTEVSDEFYQKTLQYRDAENHSIHSAYRAGLKFGFGSDLDLAAIRSRLGFEFIARKEYYTFDDIDILLQATKNSAEICGLGDEIGTVKEGKLADLVIVDGKPDEDIYVLTNPVDHVIRDGVLFR